MKTKKKQNPKTPSFAKWTCHAIFILAVMLAGASSSSTQAAAPSSPQGIVTLRTYPGDARSAILAGTAASDGVYYPKRMEGPFNGINSGSGSDPGDDAVLPPGDWRNSYTTELVGYFYPPRTGNIQFALAVDDAGELWLSSDENPANKTKIAMEPDWHSARAFATDVRRTIVDAGDPPIPRLINQSAYIAVTAGVPCFIQALAVESGGSDNAAVTFRYEDDPEFADGDLPINGQYLATIDRDSLAKLFVSKFTPSSTGFVLEIHDGEGDGAASLDAATVKVRFDDADVSSTVAQNPPVASIVYAMADGTLAAQTPHTAKITFKDTLGNDYTIEKEFTVNFDLKWQITWADYASNPIDVKSPGSRAYMPYMLYSADWPAESRYRIWYDTESIAGLACSSSPDGINWSQGAALTGINTASDSTDGTTFAGRAVVLYQKDWAKPYRLYYYGKTDTAAHRIWVAESSDGIHFENNQIALDPDTEGSRVGTYPDGHAVVYLPGRNVTPDDPEAARPFIMYFRDKNGQGIAYAESKDGFVFTEVADNPDTLEVNEGLIRISGLPEGVTVLPAHPTQVLQLAQNDFRMWAFEQNSSIKYLVSPNGLDWQLIEDPVADIGATGAQGAWNDQRNYYASAVYLGDGRFLIARTGRANDTGLYRIGIAFGESAFYKANDPGKWAFYSSMDDWQSEGWEPFSSTANNPDGNTTALLNNGNGTVSVRDRMTSGNFYMVHNAALTVPFTFEFRARLDDIDGTEGDYNKYMVGAFMTDPLHPGGESWQPAFAMTRFGGWALASDPSAEADNAQFQTYTVVCRFDESARALLGNNASDSVANVNLCVFEVYRGRDFSAPAVVYHNTGFFGWGSVDLDGRIDIGFPGPSFGQVTMDWIRWGNGVIFDPNDPSTVTPRPELSITRAATGLLISWTHGGTLQSADRLQGTWQDEPAITSGSILSPSGSQKFFRVKR